MKLSNNKSLMSIIPFILLFLLIMILLYVKYLNDRREYIESFINESLIEERIEKINDTYLYPTCDLEAECAKDGLKPAFMPTICQIGDTINAYANCKCIDNDGKCKMCYPDIKRDMTHASVIYDAYPNANSAITENIYTF